MVKGHYVGNRQWFLTLEQGTDSGLFVARFGHRPGGFPAVLWDEWTHQLSGGTWSAQGWAGRFYELSLEAMERQMSSAG